MTNKEYLIGELKNTMGGVIDKFTIGILLLAFVLSVSLTVYEAGRIKELEERVSVLAAQMAEAEKKIAGLQGKMPKWF